MVANMSSSVWKESFDYVRLESCRKIHPPSPIALCAHRGQIFSKMRSAVNQSHLLVVVTFERGNFTRQIANGRGIPKCADNGSPRFAI
jgi:hypothetical protein